MQRDEMAAKHWRKKARRTAVILLAVPVLVGVGAAQRIGISNTAGGYLNVPNGRDPIPIPVLRNDGSASSVTHLRERRGAALQAEQRLMMVREAQRILVVATDLSLGMGRQTAASAKVDDEAWQRADAIERLARNVRLRMLGAH